jgi:hypothetical protein
MALALDQKEFLDRKECARYLEMLGLKIAPKTLSNLAANGNEGDGPPYFQTRWKRVYYKRIEVEAWAKIQTRRVE